MVDSSAVYPGFTFASDIDGPIVNNDFLTRKKPQNFVVSGNQQKLYNLHPAIKTFLYHGMALYSKHAIIRPDASPTFHKIKQSDAKIIAITKRFGGIEQSKHGDRIRANTELSLMNKDIPYDDIIFVDTNKADECLALNVDVIVEDNPDNIMAISKAGVKVIVYPTKYNDFIEADGEFIFRPDQWFKDYEESIGLSSWDIIFLIVHDMIQEKKAKYEYDKEKGLYLTK